LYCEQKGEKENEDLSSDSSTASEDEDDESLPQGA
jgi:hypothetical protein